MKHLLILIAIVALGAVSANSSHAQIRSIKQDTDTLINADTSYVTFSPMNSNLKSLTAKVTKISGTVAGYVIIQGTNDGSNWENIGTDTFQLTNTTTQLKTWTFTRTNYYGYRIRGISTNGTARSILTLVYLRRPDEQY